METNTPTLDDDGYLRLKGNPGPWILNNSHDSHLLVKHLEIDFSDLQHDSEHDIHDSIDQLTFLTHLTILNSNNSLNSLPDSISSLQNLQHLEFESCNFEELPSNIGLLNTSLTHLSLSSCHNIKSLPEIVVTLSILTSLHLEDCRSLSHLTPSLGVLRNSLTHLTLSKCYLKSLPKSFAALSNLTSLHLHACFNLSEFPLCLGQLGSLTDLSLKGWKFEFLPESITSLSNLTSLHLERCDSLKELPPSLAQLVRLKDFSLENCCCLQSLPDTMSNLLNLKSLSINGCSFLTHLPDNLKCTTLDLNTTSIKFIPRGLINVQDFSMDSSWYLNDIPNFFANLNQLSNLQKLYVSLPNNTSFVAFPDNLEGLDELILLDIEFTTVKYLPWSILKLPKLQFLLLPQEFRLETLPFHLNDSVLISTIGRHIRKTWKQLKQERGISNFSIPRGGYPSIIAPPGYLSLNSGLRQWISDNHESFKQVKMLELRLSTNFDIEDTKKSIGELPNLTHLFVTYENGVKKDCFPRTVKGLKHLCLQHNDPTLSLRKLSDLYSLTLIVTTFPRDLSLPVSLRRLSLQSPHSFSFPASGNMAKLSNLHTLELRGCYNLASLPPLNIVTLKIDRIIESLPISLRHLEILHGDCFDKDSDMDCNNSMLEHCLTELVDLEMFSLTCYHIKSLPSMSGQCNLRVLLLRDCFSLKELLPDMEQLVELHTLDISGTSIVSLPDSIVKLTKLQRLTLSKCFTQKLPRKLQEVSIVDDTDKIYYNHVNSCDSTDECNDYKNLGSIEGVDEAITEDPVQGAIYEQACEQNGVIAQVPKVSSSTLKCVTNEHGTILPSSKKLKQFHNAEEGDPITDSTCLEKPSKQADGFEQKGSKDAAATTIVENQPLKTFKESNVEVLQHAKVHLDGGNQSNIAQPNGSSNSFDFVKVCYVGDPVWIDFSLTSSFDQLNESICKKFRFKLKTFKIKYLDDDKEWLLMTCVSDLTHALLHTSSSGRKFVRLSITETGVVDTELHLDGANQSNIAQPNGISSSFDFVKVCYKGDPMWIDFSLTSNFDQLKVYVCKKFGVEFNKFKIKYLDEDKEWLLMTHVSDLTHALLHTSSSRRDFVRLAITDTRVVNPGRVSEENNERIIPKKSEGGSAWVSIDSESEKSKNIQCAGEYSNQASASDCIPFPEFCVSRIKPLVEGHIDVKADGNCGFRVIATFEYGDEEKWVDVRIDLLKELHTNKDLYKKALGGDEEFERANFMVNWLTSPAEKNHWFEATCLGLVVATKYQKVFTCWSTECWTYLPLVSRLFDFKPPTKYINMACINENHFIALQMPNNIPLPPLSPLWKRHRCDSVKHWRTSIFKKQLDDYFRLRD